MQIKSLRIVRIPFIERMDERRERRLGPTAGSLRRQPLVGGFLNMGLPRLRGLARVQQTDC